MRTRTPETDEKATILAKLAKALSYGVGCALRSLNSKAGILYVMGVVAIDFARVLVTARKRLSLVCMGCEVSCSSCPFAEVAMFHST
jgi:hypothetical protein